MRAWALGCFLSLISTRTFRRALTASVYSYAEIKSAPSWRNQICWQSLEEGAGKRCSECGSSGVAFHVACVYAACSLKCWHTPNITFWHLPSNSSRIGYATVGTLFVFAQLPPTISAPAEKFWVLISQART